MPTSEEARSPDKGSPELFTQLQAFLGLLKTASDLLELMPIDKKHASDLKSLGGSISRDVAKAYLEDK